MAMMELKIGCDDVQRHARLRRNMLAIILTICCPVLMVVALIVLPRDGANIGTSKALIPVVIFAICAACFYFAARLGTERMKLTTTYLFTGTELIRRRIGWPDDRMALKDIDAVVNAHKSIVVTSIAGQRKFVIPNSFDGASSLVHELEERGYVKRKSQSILHSVFMIVITACCWLTIILSHDRAIVAISSIVTVSLLIYSSYAILPMRKRDREQAVRFSIWLLIGVAWLATLVLLYAKLCIFSK